MANKQKIVAKKLPKKFQGAEVVRGKGMNSDKLDRFVERHSFDQFYAQRDAWIVVPNDALEDDFGVELKAFETKADALVYARAMANGNVDHRVMRLTDHVLVIGTQNEL